ncbi:MAG: copper homeostasis protein CutC [Flavobacteriaceae bacterium]|nr:copper homeostasis protein CutC [Flavobacteriaceae bacterium]
MILEVCCSNIESVVNAKKTSVNRIELCSQLSIGGLTPSYGLTKLAVEKGLEVHSLIRPREGDFCYHKDELEIMYHDIKIMKELGCQGIVVGILNEDLTLNQYAMNKIIEISQDMEITFHRAIDVVKYPLILLEKLIELKIDRILSSGQQVTAYEGLQQLKKMKQISNHRIEIMPGSGINSVNCLEFKNAGFNSIHFSAFKKCSNEIGSENDSNLFSANLGESDVEEILKIKNHLKI